jgi:hypothetical protein
MTADRLAQRVRAPEQEDTDSERRGLPAPAILSICDRLLGEVGRRRHMFAWLRVPGSAAGEWLPVDAYYPRARLVVMCQPGSGPNDGLYRELVPAHGLGLLTLDPAVLGDDRAAVEAALAGKIFDLEHLPRPSPRMPSDARATAPAASAGAASDAPAGAAGGGAGEPVRNGRTSHGPEASWTPVSVERSAVAPALEQGVGVVLGLALAAVLIAELYVAVVDAAFGAGRPILGLALALDACSRALGTVAATRAGERGWACACAIGGAPIVAWFAVLRPSGRDAVEPAPLAGLLAGLAALLVLLGLLIGS